MSDNPGKGMWAQNVLDRRMKLVRKDLVRFGFTQYEVDEMCVRLKSDTLEEKSQRYSVLSSCASIARYAKTGSLVRPGYNESTQDACEYIVKILKRVVSP